MDPPAKHVTLILLCLPRLIYCKESSALKAIFPAAPHTFIVSDFCARTRVLSNIVLRVAFSVNARRETSAAPRKTKHKERKHCHREA
jgi:hypothetical protein